MKILRKKINRVSISILVALLMVISSAVFLFPVSAVNNKPKTSAGVALTIIMLGNQQKPGVEAVVSDFLSSPLGFGVDSVTVESSGENADLQLQDLQTKMQAGSATAHVIDLDTVWTATFAKNKWVISLDDYLEPNELDDYGSGIVASCEYQGHYYAYPYFMNLGVLYYRKDLLDKHMPGWTEADFSTWEGLNATANFILNNGSGLLTTADATLTGYVGQFDAYEGGVVNFFEWCGSNGALDVVTSTNDVNIDVPAVTDTMEFLHGLVTPQFGSVQGNLSGSDYSPYIILRTHLLTDEATSANIWLANNTIFLRQWPYVYALSEANGMDFGIAPLPHFAGATGYKTSCIGGGILAVPTATTGVAREAAINLTKFLGDTLAQEAELTTDIDPGPGYTAQGNFPALKSVYVNPPTTPQDFSWIKNWTEQAALTLSRPVHPDYPLISQAIAGYFSDLLSGKQSVTSALSDMQRDVKDIVAPAPAEIPGYTIGFLILSIASSIGIIILLRKKLH
jgi:ABC-type glycerol-3-phosphate transport system substrate-binding protein